jgi:hypothetical protein
MSEVSIEKQLIRDTIRELIEKLKNYIADLDQVRTVCKEQHGIETVRKIDFENGDIVSYKGKIAFKLDLQISFDLSILIDNNGKCIGTLPQRIS